LDLENARTPSLDRPREDGPTGKRPKSLGQRPGKTKCEEPLAGWTAGAGVGLVDPTRLDKEAERVDRNDGWRRDPFIQYIYIIVYIIIITEGLAVETESGGVARFKKSYIRLCLFIFILLYFYSVVVSNLFLIV
jgi:hypothetical protein